LRYLPASINRSIDDGEHVVALVYYVAEEIAGRTFACRNSGTWFVRVLASDVVDERDYVLAIIDRSIDRCGEISQ